jgi:hypothetical protein
LTQPLDPLTVQRLAFIRFVYEQGVSQADQPEPLSATAVLSFQDAVELFLRLAAEHLHVNLPTDVKFAEHWAKLEPALLPAQTQLPSKNAMDRMNRLRIELKHRGTIPSRTAIEQARGDVTTFFTDATPLVFSIDFARIDLIDVVTGTRPHSCFATPPDGPTLTVTCRAAFGRMPRRMPRSGGVAVRLRGHRRTLVCKVRTATW